MIKNILEKLTLQGFGDLYNTLEMVEDVVRDIGEKITQTGLRYLLSDNRVSMLLCGVSDLDELEDCVSVSDGQYLPDDLVAEIEGVNQ